MKTRFVNCFGGDFEHTSMKVLGLFMHLENAVSSRTIGVIYRECDHNKGCAPVILLA